MVAITVVSVIVWISSALSKAIRLSDVGDGWRALLLGAPPELL
jgi:hypothetical protein